MSIPLLFWIIVGFALIILELMVPTFILVFFGTAALITGIAISLGMPSTGAIPWLVFSVLTILQIVFLRRYCQQWFRGETLENGDPAGLDGDFIGRTADVLSDFRQADPSGNRFTGRVAYRGSHWDASSEECLLVGQRVTITHRDGMTLIVRRI